MRRFTWPGGRGWSEIHIWNQRPQFASSLYNFYGATLTIKGSLHGESPIEKLFSAGNSVTIGPKNSGFGELRRLNVKFLFYNPVEAHPCTEPRRLTYFAWKSVRGRRLWGVGRTQKRSQINIFDAQFRAYGKKKPLQWSWLNFACG